MTKRRPLLALAAAACLWPFGLPSFAHAQQPISPRHIGVLQTASWSEEMAQAFRQGLVDNGIAEGRDVVIKWQSAEGSYDRLPQLAADLVQRKVDVIIVGSSLAAQSYYVPTR